jgi:four helix bundle protein
MDIKSYKNLICWQKSIDLVVLIYKLTENFPKEEIYGITAQMRRSSISISSNIAEGSRRSSKKDFRNFLLIAYGSGAELETQLEISKRLQLAKIESLNESESLLSEIMKMLNKLCSNLK